MARLANFVFLAAFCLGAAVAKCPNACTDDYTPVCATNRNGEHKTFSNLCELDIVHCNNPAAGWFRVRDGACVDTFAPKCSKVCTQEYNPICARNKNGGLKTFPNLCVFTSAQCENPSEGWFLLRDGVCAETYSNKCNKICTAEYNPVCGRSKTGEFKTFGNLCFFNSAQCENPEAGWFRLRNGDCAETRVTKCSKICTQEYAPVCARNKNGQLKTFANLCLFTSAQCENPSSGWFMLRDGVCDETYSSKCNKVCTADYSPVCGRNKNGELKTFGNLCMFTSVQCENPQAGWFRLRDGACMETRAVKCSKVCTQEYNPVCARNKNGELKTFANLCLFTSVQCENPSTGWFILRDGVCDETYSTKCNKVCTADYTPVCGRNKNGELKTFGNLCMFTSAQCENPAAGWFRLRDGVCVDTFTTKCNTFCTAEYSPVCARNKNGEFKTFGNLCFFNSAQCENPSAGWFRLRDGDCAETRAVKKCNHICTDDYTPVCGRNKNGNLETFSNLCELEIVQCEKPTAGWFRMRDGACE